MHQNLPQFFAETLSPTLPLVFWIISPNHVADAFGLLCQNHVADLYLLMTNLDMETIQENFYYS